MMRRLIVLGLFAAGCQGQSLLGERTPPPTPIPPPPSRVSALARLEPAGKVVHVQVPALRQQDRVLEWRVQEGDRVSRGQLLVRLEGAQRLNQELAVAQARVAQFEARLEQVLAGPKSGEVRRQQAEIERLERERLRQGQVWSAQVARLDSETELAWRNYQRFRTLYQQGACSALEVEQRQLVWETARRNRQQMTAELQRSRDTLALQGESARGELQRIEEVRPTDVAAAQADVAQAQAEVRRVASDLAECRVVSPVSGRILRVHTRVGEKISTSGLADVAADDQMVAIAEVYQNDVQRLKMGQTCSLKCSALPAPLRGRIVRFASQVTRQNIFSDVPGDQFDQRVVEVRVELEASSNRNALAWTNLQLQAEFE